MPVSDLHLPPRSHQQIMYKGRKNSAVLITVTENRRVDQITNTKSGTQISTVNTKEVS